ncbi:MAG: sulfotransferase family protein [Chloroflexi bacterium]|nr:MAG: sulfotransferase family protein [Chloroflexota bacterium]PIE80022.1 MAG: sulfotransferase family protein [Chloroflexota bacterium]
MSFLSKLFGSKEKPVVYVVSGLPRSGTSMMMKMLEAGGIPPMIDEIREADSDNPKGYYEFERVKQMDKGDTSWVAEAVDKVVKVISALLKHLPSDYEYKVIFVRRHMDEILASQRQMLVNRGEDSNQMDDAQMAELFQKHLTATKKWLDAQDNFQVLYVHYSDILSDPMTQVQKINVFLGGNLDVLAMAAQVDPNLYRNRQKS